MSSISRNNLMTILKDFKNKTKIDKNMSFTGEEESTDKVATEKTVKDCYDLLFQYANNGKSMLETTIIGKGSSVSKENGVMPTFEELNNGISGIVTVRESGYNSLAQALNYKFGLNIKDEISLYKLGEIIRNMTLAYVQNIFELKCEFDPGDLTFSLNPNNIDIETKEPLKININDNIQFATNELKFTCK